MSENQKKIWITGASVVLKAVAEKFANEGWKVAFRQEEKNYLMN